MTYCSLEIADDRNRTAYFSFEKQTLYQLCPKAKGNKSFSKRAHLVCIISKLLAYLQHICCVKSLFKRIFKWTNLSLFFIFVLLISTFLQINCRLQRDSNSERQSTRRVRWPLDHHGPFNKILFIFIFTLITFTLLQYYDSRGGGPGLVVMGGDSCSKVRGFESRRHMLNEHNIFLHIFVVRIVMFVWKDENKWKRGTFF